jgi:hypothetical protein
VQRPLIKKKTLLLFVLPGILLLTILAPVQFTVTGNYEGLFLLKGTDGALFELKDDLYLNEERRYLAGVDLEYGKRFIRGLFTNGSGREPHLDFEWNQRTGAGYVRNYLPNGKQLLTCFSRFIDDNGKATAGLFVGGGLPANVRGDDLTKKNETGMAYFDGVRWFHIWCNVNEAISTFSNFESIAPSSWTFLGSDVLHHEGTDLILKSSHEIVIEGVPLHMDRYASFRAGETYFILTIEIENIGNRPATYYYLYGDEPWLGNYGSSAGNVGWAADGLHQYAGRLNTTRDHYAGFFDYGNDAINEKHDFTMAANFIEWFGNDEPFVYFSNGPSDRQMNAKKTPLSSNTRFLGVLWGPKTLQPNQPVIYTLAIGMAGRDPGIAFPIIPDIDLKSFP